MSHVDIYTTNMGFHVGVSRGGIIKGTSIHISRYSRKFEHWAWDSQINRYTHKGNWYYFDDNLQMCFFPKYDLENFIEYIVTNGYKENIIELAPCKGVEAKFYLLPHVGYKSDIQKNTVEYVVNEKSGNVRGVGLQTGFGKTAAYIIAMSKLGVRSMITMTSRLEQWVKSINDFAAVTDDDIYIVKGEPSLSRLFRLIDKDIKPKIILASSQTIRLYLEYGKSYQHLPHPSKACHELGLGIIGTDEYHEHFYTNFLIGIMFNPSVFVPITATFNANDPFVKEIFNQFIPKSVQYTGGEYKKYANITAYTLKFGGHLIKPYQYTARGMYSQVKFEEHLLSQRGKPLLDMTVREAVIPIVDQHYSKLADPGEKCLVICATKNMCEHFGKVLKSEWKDKTVSSFFSGSSTTILDKSDIILSTPGSAGTGRDIKNLRTCYVFDCTGSENRNVQYVGRLRELPSGNTPEFVYSPKICIITFSALWG